MRAGAVIVGLIMCLCNIAQAQFTQGNVVVSVIKSANSSAPNSTAQRRILREFSLSGTPTGQEYLLPTTLNGTNARLTNSRALATATEGAVTLSNDGRYLLVTGYDAPLATSNVYSTTSASVPRVVGRIDWRLSEAAGAINTSTRLTNAFNRETVRGIASFDGSTFYTAGGGTLTGGVHYVSLASSGASVTLQTLPNGESSGAWDMRNVVIRDGRLYASCGSPNMQGIGTLGSGLPTSEGQQFTLLPGFTDTTNRPHGFYFADAQTLYVADDRSNNDVSPLGGLQKWVYDPIFTQRWNKVATFRIVHAANSDNSVGAFSVTGTKDASNNTVLYVISTDSRLLKLTDRGVNSTFEVLAAAPTNEIWRGVALLSAPATGGGSGTAQISGFVTLEGCNNAAVPLTFVFRPMGGTPITQTVTPAPNGAFMTQPFPRAFGYIGVRAFNTLQDVRPVSLIDGHTFNVLISLPPGDVNGDNAVDISDLIQLIQHYNRSFRDNDFLEAADFNHDGFNDVGDLVLLIQNYNRVGLFFP